MEEKKCIKISLSTCVLIVVIIVLLLISGYLYIKNINLDRRVSGLENNLDIQENQVNNVQNKDAIELMPDSNLNNENTNSKIEPDEKVSYIEVTSESDYEMVIKTFKDNGNNTYTIIGPCYENLEIPTISEDEYNKLKNGESIILYNEEYILTNREYGNEIVINNENATEDAEIFPGYFVGNLNNGLYTLIPNTQTGVKRFTGKYGTITVKSDIEFIVNDDKLKLSDVLNDKNNPYYWYFDRVDDEVSEYVISAGTEIFEFENNECVRIKIVAY